MCLLYAATDRHTHTHTHVHTHTEYAGQQTHGTKEFYKGNYCTHEVLIAHTALVTIAIG